MSSKNVKKFLGAGRKKKQNYLLRFCQIRICEKLRKTCIKEVFNNEIFMHIQQEFMNALKLDLFKEISEKSFLDKNSIVSKYTELDIGIEKLRVKHKALKQDWSRIKDCIKNGSRLSPDKEPRWFKHLNLFFVKQMKPSVYL